MYGGHRPFVRRDSSAGGGLAETGALSGAGAIEKLPLAYGDFFSQRIVKLKSDMDSQLVSKTHKKLVVFWQKHNFTRW